MEEFPTLYMNHKDFQYTFEFTYEDLFVEKDNQYWFLVALSIYNTDMEEWFMGIIFLRKYNLIFNQDTKTISYYNINLPTSKKKEFIINEKFVGYIIIIFIIIVLSILLIIFGLYICKKNLKIKERKRLNHIYDFDYINQDNFDINKKIKYGQNLLMEMKGLIYI